MYIYFRTYLANPIQTTVELEFNPIPYPAVAFCNMNPIRKSQLGLSTLLSDAVNGKKKVSYILKELYA